MRCKAGEKATIWRRIKPDERAYPLMSESQVRLAVLVAALRWAVIGKAHDFWAATTGLREDKDQASATRVVAPPGLAQREIPLIARDAEVEVNRKLPGAIGWCFDHLACAGGDGEVDFAERAVDGVGTEIEPERLTSPDFIIAGINDLHVDWCDEIGGIAGY